MGRLITVALRNVLRNKRRSAISILAIFFGVGVVIFLDGFTNGFLKNTVEDAVFAKVGALQVHRKGYLDAEKDPLKLDVADDNTMIDRLKAVKGVTEVTRRLSFEGMLSNGSVSSMFMATAIDPVTEYKVCPKRKENVAKGSTPLDEKSPNGALLGHQLMESLDAKPGSTLTMLSASQGGAQNALDVNVHGLLPSRFIGESKRLATVTLPFAQELLRMPGRVTEYVIRIDNLDHVDDVATRLRATLGPDYEVNTWPELAPQARDGVVRLRVVLASISFILFCLVVSGIVNTMLMSVSERVREIGTMLAVGTRRRQVLLLFLIEAGALGLVGAVFGALAGAWVVHRMGSGSGLNISPPGGDPIQVYPYVELRFAIMAVLLAIGGALLAALYPSWKASRMRPVDALRAN
jgi:putative ABC transport system permease protein